MAYSVTTRCTFSDAYLGFIGKIAHFYCKNTDFQYSHGSNMGTKQCYGVDILPSNINLACQMSEKPIRYLLKPIRKGFATSKKWAILENGRFSVFRILWLWPPQMTPKWKDMDPGCYRSYVRLCLEMVSAFEVSGLGAAVLGLSWNHWKMPYFH